jgi:hypothetical protein
LVGPLGVTSAYANAVWWAMMLARDLDTCCALLRGDPVDRVNLDAGWLEAAAAFQLVRLDTYAIDLLHRRAELRALLTDTAA